jgi:anti-sigma B factor antagonist
MFDLDKLEIHQREREGIPILDLNGRLVMGASDSTLREAVQLLFDRGNRKLILNLAGVSKIDTAGAGALLFLSQEYRTAGGKLVLFQLAHAHGELYEMAHLEAALEIYGEELDAVNSFFPERAVRHYDILDFIEHPEQNEAEFEKKPEPQTN